MPRSETQRTSSITSTNHQTAPQHPLKANIRRRVRTRQACESCRRRRRKCDGGLPCSQCEGYSYACQYDGRHPNESLIDQNPGGGNDHDDSNDYSHVPDASSSLEPARDERPRQSTSRLTTTQRDNRLHQGEDRGGDGHLPMPRPVVDTAKGRYSNAHSSILLTRRVEQSINMTDRVRFHSYGWNLNTRLEPTSFVAPAICRHLTYQDLCYYSRIFFKTVDPIYHVLDEELFFQKCGAILDHGKRLPRRSRSSRLWRRCTWLILRREGISRRKSACGARQTDAGYGLCLRTWTAFIDADRWMVLENAVSASDHKTSSSMVCIVLDNACG